MENSRLSDIFVHHEGREEHEEKKSQMSILNLSCVFSQAVTSAILSTHSPTGMFNYSPGLQRRAFAGATLGETVRAPKFSLKGIFNRRDRMTGTVSGKSPSSIPYIMIEA